MAVRKDPRTLELAEPFVSLFPVEPETLELVKGSIREHGFQADKPVLVWKDAFGERGRQVVVDGHTRLQAARDLRLPEVWATMRQFKSADAAVTAGIGEQVQRRNLNRQQIAAYVISILPLLDETKGGLRSRTAKELAKMLGVSVPTIDRTRGILASGDEKLIEQVKSGELSILAAYDLTTGREPLEHDEWEPTTEQAETLRGLEANLGAALLPGGKDDAKARARELAAIPNDVFEEYLNTEPNPTHEGAMGFAAVRADEGSETPLPPHMAKMVAKMNAWSRSLATVVDHLDELPEGRQRELVLEAIRSLGEQAQRWLDRLEGRAPHAG